MKLLLLPLLASAFVLLLGASRPEDEDPAEPKDGAEENAKDEEASPSEREKQVLTLFNATSKKFVKGKLVLTYDFESSSRSTSAEDIAQDWQPPLEQSKPRIRWSGPGEGTATTVEHGIIVGDHGNWIHKGVFLPDLMVTVDQVSVSQFRPGTILGPIFYSEKKKQAIGVTGGFQAICVKGWTLAKPPHPKNERPIPTSARHTVGYKYNGKVLESYWGGKKTSDTAAVPRFTEGFDTGHVGLAWNGSVQCFVFKVTIEGSLDPDWVSKQLGEKSDKPAKSGDTGSKPSQKKQAPPKKAP